MENNIEKFVAGKLNSGIGQGEREALYKLFPDQYEEVIKKSLGDIQKALDSGVIGQDMFQKALMNLGHLVPKKVQVKGKDGQMHWAVRWTNPTTGEAEKIVPIKKEIATSGELEQRVTEVVMSDLNRADKVRNLFNMGIYDPDVVSVLTGMGSSDVKWYFKTEFKADLASLVPDKSAEIKVVIKEQQSHNDTPEDIEKNKLLNNDRNIKELWENYDKNLKRVMLGRHKFAVCYGKGGVGKSFHCEEMLKGLQLREYDDEVQPNKEQYDYVTIRGKISPAQVYAEMYRHRDKLVIFDDCDSFLKMDEVQGFLKGGLDTGENTRISNKTSRKMYNVEGDKESGEIPNTFRFTGRVIAITNLTADDIEEAVFSRALTSNLTMTIDETMDQLSDIKDKIKIYSADKATVIEIDQQARDLAFDYLKEYKEIVADRTNTRVLSNAMLMVDEGIKEGTPIERIKREVKSYYDAIANTFGKQQSAISKLQTKGK